MQGMSGTELEPKLRVRNSTQVSQAGDRDPSAWAVASQVLHSQEAGVRSQRWEHNPGTPVWDKASELAVHSVLVDFNSIAVPASCGSLGSGNSWFLQEEIAPGPRIRASLVSLSGHAAEGVEAFF